MIKTVKELTDWFINNPELISTGVFVSSEIRSELYTGQHQGMLTLNGIAYPITSEDYKGGVYRLRIIK